MTKQIRWATLATGGIAKTFCKDLLVDPTTRNVTSIKHTITAAASSTSADRASQFLADLGVQNAKAYGSYAELVQDPNVDIIYVATPHSHHYQNAMLCLQAGKNVLCEKAFTVNAAQARKLVEVAKSKGVFLMEAVWTRYFPLSQYVRDLITSGALGTVTRVTADCSINARPSPEEAWADGKSRMINPELAGGALLDLGIYSLTWLFMTLYSTQSADKRQRPSVVCAVKKYAPSGVDEQATMVLTFPREDGGDAHGIATTGLRADTDPGKGDTPCVRIQGSKGEVQVFGMAFKPTRTKVVWGKGRDGKGEVEVEEKDWEQPGGGHGMFWEADEAATAVLEGRKEGGQLGWDESVLIMEIMDEVRKQGGITYPEKIETLDYPVDL